jgi:hypothetical protein
MAKRFEAFEVALELIGALRDIVPLTRSTIGA